MTSGSQQAEQRRRTSCLDPRDLPVCFYISQIQQPRSLVALAKDTDADGCNHKGSVAIAGSYRLLPTDTCSEEEALLPSSG